MWVRGGIHVSGRQPEALDVFQCPLQGVRLIEASAGTGKTWNICGLYLRLLIENGLEVQQILVVTFTKAATAELRERVRERITQVLARLEERGPESADPFVTELLAALHDKGFENGALIKLLTRAARNFDEAAIFTIHGFCKRALDDTPFAAGLPLAQEMIEDDGELRQEVANDFWRREVAGGGIAPQLAGWLLERKDSPQKFAEILKRHAGKPLSAVVWPEGTGDGMPDLDDSEFRHAHAQARALWRAGRSGILACVAEALPRLNGNLWRPGSLETAAEQWDEVLAAADPNECPPTKNKLKNLTPECLKPKARLAACGHHDFFVAAQTVLDAWKSLQARLEQARWVLLRRLAEEGPEQLRRRKRERRVVAFDDMLFNLHERLHGERGAELAATLRQRFPAALIDEFQDTDPLQFEIFDSVYGGADGLLFLVGDPKQAIYSFRNADLHTYLQARGRAQAEYTLAENQRSTPAMLAGLNALFEANPRAFMLEGLDYHPVRAGKKPRKPLVDRTRPRAALQLWRLPSDGDEDGAVDKKDAKHRAVRACAGEIARLLGAAERGEVTHDGRPLAAGDIAVLVRSHAEGSLMRRELQALGVGSVELSQTSVFDSADAQELERILTAVLEPRREPLLRAALATELLGCTAADLEALSDHERAVLRRMAQFSDYRDTWLRHGAGPMLRQLVAAEGIAARMLLRADGERRLTNLRHLSECLHEAAREHPGPEALLRWLQRQRREHEGGEATQVRLESDQNLVQIVTIHKSKGLEYPIVFCPFLWDGSAGGGGEAIPREYHDEAGRPVIDYRDLADDPDVKRRMRMEADAERLRLIYVALTRAVHRCYLVVGAYSVKSFGRPSTSECSGNPLNWLVAGAGIAPDAWRERKAPAQRIVDAWSTLAGMNSPHIAIEALPDAAPQPVDIPRPAPDSLAARPPPAHIASGWRIGSYSSLAHGAKSEAAADHDLRVEAAAGEHAEAAPTPRESRDRALATLPADDILRFPRGARAGETLHAVFERADFADPSQWPEVVVQALRFKPPQGSGDSESWAAMVLRLLADVTGTPLPAGHRLADVARDRRLVELEFSLPAAGLDARALAATLRRHGYPVAGLAFGRLEGYLRGFIDLVYEHQGRFHVLDWKSNHLGWNAADYAGAKLADAMARQGYHLQYLLYAVALHRYLRQRLRGYDHERHFGGVSYLFVRGVRPAWTDADGSAAGVYFHRPSLAVIEELDALLGERDGAMA
ncbi:exodeoxyribonuclease V subunit beta [Ramlibacter sp.]|uniref:exodeoxyribonuclease V subunit beta n=1 Tax=Ramlibacter sp. TaxID=1917967 RepID=UPI002B515FBB|nr:exodeoxyribonuclease V subunit beta [Ramlibacter sp.]HWI81738.1 exodeoxyribonuclease V subunit beta [Ramlibacter sp.]